MKKYLNIWTLFTLHGIQTSFASRFGFIIFTIAKLLRFFFFLFFLAIITGRTKSVAGFTLWELIFIYATFNLIDTVPQMLFRSVYRFKSYVVNGFFDFYLIQPLSPLFRAILGSADILDLHMLFISIGFILYSGIHLPSFSIFGVILYLLLLLNALLVATAFHILVVSLGVATTEVDSTIMLYRDLTQMGRLPISVYQQTVSFILTFVIPVGIMVTFPVQALLGTLSFQFITYSFIFGITFFTLSLVLWKKSLRSYASASS